MKRIADVYGRALFPSRYAAHREDHVADRQTGTLPADGLDLAIAGGVYRLVNAVEELLDGLRQRPRRAAPAVSEQAPSAVGCG